MARSRSRVCLVTTVLVASILSACSAEQPVSWSDSRFCTASWAKAGEPVDGSSAAKFVDSAYQDPTARFDADSYLKLTDEWPMRLKTDLATLAEFRRAPDPDSKERAAAAAQRIDAARHELCPRILGGG